MTLDFKKLTKSDKIKFKIIKILTDFREHTPSEIATKLKTNGETVLKNCYFLKFLGLIDIDEKKTMRKVYYIKLKQNQNPINIDELIKNIANSGE